MRITVILILLVIAVPRSGVGAGLSDQDVSLIMELVGSQAEGIILALDVEPRIVAAPCLIAGEVRVLVQLPDSGETTTILVYRGAESWRLDAPSLLEKQLREAVESETDLKLRYQLVAEYCRYTNAIEAHSGVPEVRSIPVGVMGGCEVMSAQRVTDKTR